MSSHRARRSAAERAATWKRCLVDDPRGWSPGGGEGSIRYSDEDLSAFTDSAGVPVPVVLFAGRFMHFKRLQLLIEAHHRMRSTTACRSVLVIAGGFPGEWEGEHPYDTVQRLGADGVFFAGWRDHADLAEFLSCCDVFAAPSGRRAVRARLPRGDGRRMSADRNRHRWSDVVHQRRRRRTDRLAGRAR